MMASIPKNVKESPLSYRIEKARLKRTHQGKVRDSYNLGNNLMMSVATDRISIFDFVLSALVPDKGKILTAITVFWLTRVLKGINHHLVGYGPGIDMYLQESPLRSIKELQERALVVRLLDMEKVECVIRAFLTGNGLKEYNISQSVCGNPLPPGLHDGSRLPCPIFTPTTKEEKDHDKPILIQDFEKQHGRELIDLSINIFDQGAQYAAQRGIILADTKFEFGREHNSYWLADEVLTPDSSRWWDFEEWEKAFVDKKAPPPHDKQLVRNWGKKIPTPFDGIVGIHNLNPLNDDHIDFVSQLTVPSDILEKTAKIYQNIAKRLMA